MHTDDCGPVGSALPSTRSLTPHSSTVEPHSVAKRIYLNGALCWPSWSMAEVWMARRAGREASSVMIPSHRIFILLLVVALSLSLVRGEGECYPNDRLPDKNEAMETCCWYSQSTCCDSQDYDGFLDDTRIVFDAMRRLIEDRDHIAITDEVQRCFDYWADAYCALCSPNSAHFIRKTDGKLTMSICESFCEGFYEACKDVPYYLDMESGSDMCNYLASQWTDREVVVRSGRVHCFAGVGDHEQIASSECVPFPLSTGDVAAEPATLPLTIPGTTDDGDRQPAVTGGWDVATIAVVGFGVIMVGVFILIVVLLVVARRSWRSAQPRTYQEVEMDEM